MKKGYRFDWDERVDYALECTDIMYEYLEDHFQDYQDCFDLKILEHKLKEKTLAAIEIKEILKCIEQRTR